MPNVERGAIRAGAGIAAPARWRLLGATTLVATTLVAALVLGASIALGSGGAVAPSPADSEDVSYGVEIYLGSYCGACHSLTSAGTTGAFGPTHDDARSRAEERLSDPNYRGRATTIAEYLRESIVEPAIYVVPGYAATPHAMPAYTNFSERELAALIDLLMQP
ncbi:MAG: c-type cytochrome [Trueperaceae bacterium]|nr:c-type cytochrome [Trueperaceae bacterium]